MCSYFLPKTHMLALIVSPLESLCIRVLAESKYIINSYKFYKCGIQNMVTQVLKVSLVIWTIAFTCLELPSPFIGEGTTSRVSRSPLL